MTVYESIYKSAPHLYASQPAKDSQDATTSMALSEQRHGFVKNKNAGDERRTRLNVTQTPPSRLA